MKAVRHVELAEVRAHDFVNQRMAPAVLQAWRRGTLGPFLASRPCIL